MRKACSFIFSILLPLQQQKGRTLLIFTDPSFTHYDKRHLILLIQD